MRSNTVASIHFIRGFADYCVMKNGDILGPERIANFDHYGEEASADASYEDISFVVIGPCSDGLFYTCMLEDWQLVPEN